MLEATGVTRIYNGKIVLDGVDITVAPGSATVVVGPSGAGKSTLVRCLAILEKPDCGTIKMDGVAYTYSESANGLSLPWPKLTVVFQQHFLWPHLTLSDNITLPLRHRMPAQAIKHVLDELVHIFEMSEFVKRYPNEASMGQRQRVAIARAFALQPQYILLDEVTSSLDVEQSEKLFRQLLLLTGKGIGIIVVTHFLGLARAILSHVRHGSVVFLDHGKAIGNGGLELLDAPSSDRIRSFVSGLQLVS